MKHITQRITQRIRFGLSHWLLHLVVSVSFLTLSTAEPVVYAKDKPIRIGMFQVDATPPVGSPLAYDAMESKTSTLWLKGVVLQGSGMPIVLVAVDWIGIGGAGHTRFREAIAKATGSTADRVAVHCLHQHDAPRFDMSAADQLAELGLMGEMFNERFCLDVIKQAAAAAKNALASTVTVTHIGLGQAKVEKVASNRRIIGPNGKVIHTRWTATRDPKVRAFPEGTIDPFVKSIAFYNGERLLSVLTYYATHPQSFYRTKAADADFPGMAREQRQQELGAMQVHFNGAGGNVTAGKYNDGAKENRPVLAKRLAKGMADAFATTEKHAVTATDLDWQTVPVVLPPATHLDEEKLMAIIEDESQKAKMRNYAAYDLAFLRRCKAGHKTEIACLSIGKARVLHMPGELFVEYQLNAAKLRPDLFVAMAAYGDYSPGYIGTEVAYSQGGYETSARASNVAPEVEAVLMGAIKTLLK